MTTQDGTDDATGAAEPEWGGALWAAADLVTPMAVRVVATLRVADLVVAGVATGPALADRLGVALDPLVRVLDHVVTAGFLTRDADGGYALTDAGQWLRDDHPAGVRAWVDLEGAVGHADLALVDLLHTVRTGEPAFPHHYGLDFWADLAQDPSRAASFDALMGGSMATDADVVASAYGWDSLGEVVDVGGGDGTLLIALLRAHPTLRGIVLDLAAPAALAARALASAGLGDRGRAVTGSLFGPLPPGAGGYLLARVLHDWSDDDVRRILRTCAEAAGDSGRVLVIEDVDPDRPVSTNMDLRMLAYFLGRERTLPELTALAEDAGLRLGVVVAAPPRAVVELLPSGVADVEDHDDR